MNIIQKIISFFKWECPYSNQCLLYDPTSPTCNSPTALNGYCGEYREYIRNKTPIVSNKKMYFDEIGNSDKDRIIELFFKNSTKKYTKISMQEILNETEKKYQEILTLIKLNNEKRTIQQWFSWAVTQSTNQNINLIK